MNLCVLCVFVLYSRVSLSSCPFLNILHCLPRAVGAPLEAALDLVSRMSPCGAHNTHACCARSNDHLLQYCGVLQCVAVCCSVLQCATVCCMVLQCVGIWGTYQLPTRALIQKHYGAVCCRVLQCVAVCCSVLQRGAACCIVMHYGAACCSLLQCATVFRSVLHCVAVCCIVLLCIALWCNVLQRGDVWCGVIQCVAVRCSMLQSFGVR